MDSKTKDSGERGQDANKDIPSKAKEAVFVESLELPAETPVVKGYDWNNGVDYKALLETYRYCGFQATNVGLAIEEIKNMLQCRDIPLREEQEDSLEDDDFIRRRSNCTVFLGYTSNMVSSGVRDTIRFLVQHRLVDCIVTTAGGVEEDLIKCLAPTYIGDFHLKGSVLRDKGINRIGNLLVPNDNYCMFEDWIMPHLDTMLEEQKKKGTLWTPSKVIERLGLEINDESSICYWAARNQIPIFSPALTDGSLGDMMFFHSYKNPSLVLDILQDLRRINTMAMKAVNSGVIILGGGVIKHHICNANLMRNGADYAVFINTGSEYDGSDSGARPDEAVSWGKIKKTATPVKVLFSKEIPKENAKKVQDNNNGFTCKAKEALFVKSVGLPADTPVVRGYDWNKGVDYKALLESYRYCGFQATNVGLAIDEINKMLKCRDIPLSESQRDYLEKDDFIRRKSNCTIFLGYTSNMVSSGVRDTIRFLVQHRLVDCIVTTAGGIEEDFIKCLAPTYIGDFHLKGSVLRDKGINRIGNLLVPNDNYCLFEDWIMPHLDTMLHEQKTKGTLWTPSKVIERLGLEINDQSSICYWAARNHIPIFSPALTDGSLGDMFFFHSYKNPGLVLDLVHDLQRLNTIVLKAVNTGVVIVGGGVVKHHICNANLMRNGADHAVFINTGSDFDGSDSGAPPDEAISWGKIKKTASPIKIFGEATLIFPLLVGETFATYHHGKN